MLQLLLIHTVNVWGTINSVEYSFDWLSLLDTQPITLLSVITSTIVETPKSMLSLNTF